VARWKTASELATLWGGYMEKIVLTTKLPQDGKYNWSLNLATQVRAILKPVPCR
jgi:hypothetical protein